MLKDIWRRYRYDWCIIKSDNTVHFYSEKFKGVNFSYLNDKAALINATAYIDDIGLLHIEGEELIWNLAIDKQYVSEMEEKPAKKYIKKTKGIKWLGIKPKEYVQGWYCLTRKKKANYILKQYMISIED